MLKWGSSLDGVNILLENKYKMFFLVKIFEIRDFGLIDWWFVCVIWGIFFYIVYWEMFVVGMMDEGYLRGVIFWIFGYCFLVFVCDRVLR